MAGPLVTWLKDRFGWVPFHAAVLDRRVPRAPWYFGDGATLLLLLGVQVLTGAVLMLTYSPSADSAYASVVAITQQEAGGWFIRALHYWSAGLMVVMLVVHVARQVLLGGYKSPREGTWLLGVVLFLCVGVMAFTGYLLRWDERAIYGIRVALHGMHRVPLVGESLVMFVQGGPEIGPRTLTRLFAVHVFIVPLVMFLTVGWHLYLVVLHGTTSHTERQVPVRTAEEQRSVYHDDAESPERGEWFHPFTAFKSGAMATAVLGVAIVLAIVKGPAQLDPEANLVDSAVPAEEWWFWWYSGLVAQLPHWTAPTFIVLFPVAVLLVLVLLPFIDRSPRRGVRKRPLFAVAVVLIVVALLYLTDLRRRSPWTGWPNSDPPPIPENFELTEQVERGRLLFARYGCNSCHAIAGHGPVVGPDLATVEDRMSLDEIRRYTLRPPADVAMPPYEGRLSADELERIVEFVHVAQTFPRRH